MRKSVLSRKVNIALENACLEETVSTEGFLGDIYASVKDMFKKPKNLNELKKLIDDNRVKLDQISAELKKTVLKPGWLDDATVQESIELSLEATQSLSFKGALDPQLLTTVEQAFKSAKQYFTAYAPKVKAYADELNKLPNRINREAKNLDDDALEQYVTNLVKEILKFKAPSDGMSYPAHLPGSVTLKATKESFGSLGTLFTVEPSVTKVKQGVTATLSSDTVLQLAKIAIEAIELDTLVNSTYNIGLDYGFEDEDLYERFNSTGSGDVFWDLAYYQSAWSNWTEGAYEYNKFIKELIRLISNSIK